MGSSGWKATSLMEPAWPGSLYKILLLVVSHTYTNLQGITENKAKAFQGWGQAEAWLFKENGSNYLFVNPMFIELYSDFRN